MCIPSYLKIEDCLCKVANYAAPGSSKTEMFTDTDGESRCKYNPPYLLSLVYTSEFLLQFTACLRYSRTS